MDVTIHYCRLCGLKEPAEEIAAALRREFGLTCEAREAFWGTFRIEHQGEEVFNRWKSRGLLGRIGLGRTPSVEDIVPQFTRRLRNEGAAHGGRSNEAVESEIEVSADPGRPR